jgi:hypothetical protein
MEGVNNVGLGKALNYVWVAIAGKVADFFEFPAQLQYMTPYQLLEIGFLVMGVVFIVKGVNLIVLDYKLKQEELHRVKDSNTSGGGRSSSSHHHHDD